MAIVAGIATDCPIPAPQSGPHGQRLQ